VSERDAPLDPPVQVRRERDVAETGQSVGRLLDVVPDAVDLLEHHDPGTRPGLRQRHVGVHDAVRRLNPLDPNRACHGAED
jgi:hypothetical protein